MVQEAGMARPLEDVRIIAIEQYGAGPWGSVHLADLGADVIKIEDPRTGGDVGRYVPPFQEEEDSLFYEAFNRNKRSLSLDITTESGRTVLHDLVRQSDVLYSNLRGDVPAKLGLRYTDLAPYNRRIVCCSLSAYGMDGPRAKDPGYDYMIQGLSGWMDLTGEPEGPPTKSGLSLVDFSGGFVAAIAVLAGVHAARRDGRGMDCDLSLFDTAISLLNYPAAWHLNGGFTPERTRHSAHPSLVPFQNFQTADDWIVVGCAKEKFWRRLAAVVGGDELAGDPRFVDFAARREHRDELIEILEARFKERSATEWLEELAAAGVPCGPINDVAAALRDEQTLARGMIIETEHERFGTVKQVASPVRIGDAPIVHRAAPRRHADADDILHGLLGYDPDTVASYAASGAFGAVDGTGSAA
jgi:crotonobetainyl-CoA:carnitine CoA-transferase CaiB-like acyl-CoA transferase